MSRVALFALLTVCACKNEPATPTTKVPLEPAMTTPPAPSGWAQRTGPGFTINAPGDATRTHADATDRDPAADVYTFHRTDKERYEVRVIVAEGSLSRAIATLRDRIAFSATQIRTEDYLPEGVGEARGVDIQYVVSEDFPSQYARTRMIAAKGTVYQVRALFPKERDADAATFIESFALGR